MVITKENKTLDKIKSRLAELSKLKNNWDGYGSKSINHEAASTAVTILSAIYGKKDCSPNITLGEVGQLIIEWDMSHIEQGREPIEMHINASNDIYILP